MEPRPCVNCGTELVGEFCHRCGQSAHNPLGSVRAFLADALGDIFHLRSGTLYSVRSLFNPGFLTTEYIAGRRARYVGPLQLYFLAGAVFFLMAAVRPVVEFDAKTRAVRTTLGALSVGGRMSQSEVTDLASRGITLPVFRERFGNHVSANLPSFLILSVLLFALVLRVIYSGYHRNVLEHTVFALHWIAFFLLLMVLERALPEAVTAAGKWQLFITLIAMVYLMKALRRVYADSWPWTLAKGFVVFLLFNIILALWVAGVTALAFTTI